MTNTAATTAPHPDAPDWPKIIGQLIKEGKVVIDVPPRQYDVNLGTNLRLAISKKRESSNRFIAFLRRHRWTMVFSGAILVLSTFIVKDALREHLKDLSDAVGKSQARYLARHDTDEIHNKLSLLLKYAENIESKVTLQLPASRQFPEFNRVSEDKLAELVDPYWLYRTEMTNRLEASNAVVTNGWNLVAELPDSEDKVKLSKAKRQLQEDMDHLRVDILARLPFGESDDVDSLTSKFEADALDLATKHKNKIAERYDICTNISYALYFVLLILGLVSKVAGTDLADSE